MTEVDLIPGDYRLRLRLGRSIRSVALAVVAVLAVTLIAVAALRYRLAQVSSEIASLQQQQAISARQREALASFTATRDRYQHQLALLQGLRSGTTAVSMFESIDQALSGDDVWFLDWEFQRAGSAVHDVEKARNTGYFIVLPAGTDDAGEEAWKIETHMSIRGQARDHAALSRFVRRLLEQPEIQDVRILNTALRETGPQRVVEFELAVIVNTAAMDS